MGANAVVCYLHRSTLIVSKARSIIARTGSVEMVARFSGMPVLTIANVRSKVRRSVGETATNVFGIANLIVP